MLGLQPGTQTGYRRLSFVPVIDTGQQRPPGFLVPLNEPVAATDGPGPTTQMPGLRHSQADAVMLPNGGKVQEFYREGSVLLRWTTVQRAVSVGRRLLLPPPSLPASSIPHCFRHP